VGELKIDPRLVTSILGEQGRDDAQKAGDRKDHLARRHAYYCGRARELFLAKNEQYGDSISEFGMLGTVLNMRANSKRLRTMLLDRVRNPEKPIQGAALEDIGIDLLNYAAAFLIFLEENNLTGKE
jgi:hypothetical protein